MSFKFEIVVKNYCVVRKNDCGKNDVKKKAEITVW